MEFLRNSFFCFFVIVCIFQSTFGASMNGTNVTDISPAPNTAPTSVVPVVTDGVVNVTSSNSTNIASTAATESPPVPPTTPALKTLNMTITITINSVNKSECEEIKAAFDKTPAPAGTTASPVVTTAAPDNNSTGATTDVASNVTEGVTNAPATTAPAFKAPAPKAPAKPKTDRKVSTFDPATFVDNATIKFEEWFRSAGAKDVNITIEEIKCGSITQKAGVMATHTKGTNEDFKVALNNSAKTITIQGREVKTSELTDAAGSAVIETEKPVKPVEPDVTPAGLTEGAIAGIVIGVLVLLLVIGFVIFFLKKSSRKSAQITSTSRVKLSEVAE